MANHALLRNINLAEVLKEESEASGRATLPPDLSDEQLQQWSEEQIRAYYAPACTATDAPPVAASVGVKEAASPTQPATATASCTLQLKLEALQQHFPSAAPAELLGKWFPGLQLSRTDVQDPTAVLLCFHSSGNAEDMFTAEGTGSRRAPSPLLQACRERSWKLLAVQLPGRSQRLKEPPVQSLQELAQQLLPLVAPQLLRVPGCRYALVGHSMGAWAAYELLLALTRAGFPEPAAACLSAMPWPHISLPQRPWRQQRHLNEQQFVEECRGWDINDLVFSPGMWQMYQPLLRSDFRLFDEYEPSSNGVVCNAKPPFGFPLRLFWGSKDRRVKKDMVQEWARYTSGACHTSCIPGNHLWPLDPGPKQHWLQQLTAALVDAGL